MHLQKGQPVDCSLQRSTTAALQPSCRFPQCSHLFPHFHAALYGDPAVTLWGVCAPFCSVSHSWMRSGRSSATVPLFPVRFLSSAHNSVMALDVLRRG